MAADLLVVEGDDLWLPPGLRPRFYTCPGCQRKYPEAQEKAFLRHFDGCGQLAVAAQREEREADPLRQRDEEQIRWLRRDAHERGLDPFSHGPKSKPRRRSRALKGVAGT